MVAKLRLKMLIITDNTYIENGFFLNKNGYEIRSCSRNGNFFIYGV